MVPPPEESRKKMKKYTLNITAAMLFALVTISPALVGSSCVAPKGEQEDTASTAIKKDHRTEIQQSRSAGQCHFLWKNDRPQPIRPP